MGDGDAGGSSASSSLAPTSLAIELGVESRLELGVGELRVLRVRLATVAGGWFVNELETAPDACMTHWLLQLVTAIDLKPRFESNERMRGMVPRAAGGW